MRNLYYWNVVEMVKNFIIIIMVEMYQGRDVEDNLKILNREGILFYVRVYIQ